MAEWIILGKNRAINLAQVQDIEFYAYGGVVYATVRLASFNPTTADKQGTTWFSVSGAELERLRACIERDLAPEFAGQLGPGGPRDTEPTDPRHAYYLQS